MFILKKLNFFKEYNLMETISVTTHFDIGLFNQLERFSNISSQSKNSIIADATQQYLDNQLYNVDAIKKGLEQADAHNYASDHDVRIAFQKWGVHI